MRSIYKYCWLVEVSDVYVEPIYDKASEDTYSGLRPFYLPFLITPKHLYANFFC